MSNDVDNNVVHKKSIKLQQSLEMKKTKTKWRHKLKSIKLRTEVEKNKPVMLLHPNVVLSHSPGDKQAVSKDDSTAA